jgi:surfeit locus 1 family protein
MDHSAHQEISLSWHPDWRTSLFAGLLVPALLSLGVWQLQRAQEKEQLEAVWTERQQGLPQTLPPATTAPEQLAYRRVALEGELLAERTFLLDNRMRGRRYGQEVLTPLRLADTGALVLINRGWVAGDPSRRQLPQIVTPAGVQRVFGTVYVSPGAAYTLGAETTTGDWPRQLLTIDIAAIEAMLGEPVFPYSIRLDSESPAALEANWPGLNSSPQKHRAYAWQWFSMALVLAILYLIRSSNLLAWLGQGRRHD